jgi:hypothetical protein
MSGAVVPSQPLRRVTRIPSLLATWRQRRNRSEDAGRQPEREIEQQARSWNVTAGPDESRTSSRPDVRIQNDNDNEHGNAQGLADNNNTETRPSGRESKFWRYWCWFCLCCCDMTEKDLAGLGWSGANRPRHREAESYAPPRQRREMERLGRHASGNEINEMRTQIRLRNEMMYRPRGSQGDAGV